MSDRDGVQNWADVIQSIRGAAYVLRQASRYNDDAENRRVYADAANDLEEVLEYLKEKIKREG